MDKMGARRTTHSIDGLNRREFLKATSLLLAAATLDVACGNSGGEGSDGTTPAPSLGPPNLSQGFLQAFAAYVREVPKSGFHSRVNLISAPENAEMEIEIRVFDLNGNMVIEEREFALLQPNSSRHLEMEEVLQNYGVPLPFEGNVWIGSRPSRGITFTDVQAINLDWYDRVNHASVHGMRDFNNSNNDNVHSDMITPRVFANNRYVSYFALLNSSGDGGPIPALTARPEILVVNGSGEPVARKQIEIPPYGTRFFSLDELGATDALAATGGFGALRAKEPDAPLVGISFLVERDTGSILSADHFFDRHFIATVLPLDLSQMNRSLRGRRLSA